METSGCQRQHTIRLWSFNGAMTFQSWKLAGSVPVVAPMCLLQWSHDLSVMETCECERAPGRLCCFNGAMTFQSWKLQDKHHNPASLSQRFNGAMTFQSWKPPLAL